MNTKIELSILFFLMVTSYSFSQTNDDKSHYLKKAVVLCPVDITHLFSREGFLKGNSATLDTITRVEQKGVKVTVKDSASNLFEEKNQLQKITTTDTVFLQSIIIGKDLAYNVIQQVGSFSIIKFWPSRNSKGEGLINSLTGPSLNGGTLVNFDSMRTMEIKGLTATLGKQTFDLSKSYYLVKTKTLNAHSIEFENKKGIWSIGLLIMPVKIRPFATEKGQFDFANGFSVGTTFAWTVHHNWRTNFTHNLLLYVGISSYTADSTKLKEERNDYKIATFSPAIGWMWEKNGVQLSILTGIDFPSGNLQQKWVYRNQPWIGLGVGIGLFKIDNEKNASSEKNP
jgi:hypothetical protein